MDPYWRRDIGLGGVEDFKRYSNDEAIQGNKGPVR